MAVNRVETARQHLITPTPTPLGLNKRQGTSTATSHSYPECLDDPTGPCQLQTSFSAACAEEFQVSSFYQKMYCLCTVGYYERSAECRQNCYPAARPSPDPVSISRESRMVALDCESYSLAIESEAAFYSSLNAVSMSLESAESEESATATAGSGVGSTAGSVTGAGAGAGAVASGVAPETMTWVDRPISTGQAQQNGGAPTVRATRYKALSSVAVILALLSVFHTR